MSDIDVKDLLNLLAIDGMRDFLLKNYKCISQKILIDVFEKEQIDSTELQICQLNNKILKIQNELLRRELEESKNALSELRSEIEDTLRSITNPDTNHKESIFIELSNKKN